MSILDPLCIALFQITLGPFISTFPLKASILLSVSFFAYSSALNNLEKGNEICQIRVL